MRIGDAERTDVADRLAKHFSDGRLDETEFGERLDRAMRAKTMADLSGLLADLPSDSAPPLQGGRRHQRAMAQTELDRERLALKAQQQAHRQARHNGRRRRLRLLVLFVGLVFGALMVAHWMAHSVALWIIVGVIAFLWLRRNTAHGDHGG
jgi:hypothetical protein